MWRTPAGTRSLEGSEAELIRQLIGYVYFQIDVVCRDIDEPYSIGIDVFDRLSAAQQLALLAEIGESLLLERTAPTKLSAVREATVAVLFEELQSCIESEIEIDTLDEPTDCFWRTLVRQAMIEQPKQDASLLPETDSPNLDDWTILVECLAARILWDDDWAMESEFADATPETNRRLKAHLGIEDDYFIDIAPDPTDQQLSAIRDRLAALDRQGE